MDIIRLRTLTEKSILGFGKYAEMSIQQIIDIQKSHYLIWVYYNISAITFIPKILDEIHIYKNYRIFKPGINEQLFNKYTDYKFNPATYHDPIVYFSTKNRNIKNQKNNFKRRQRSYSIISKKSVLQAKNHGH